MDTAVAFEQADGLRVVTAGDCTLADLTARFEAVDKRFEDMNPRFPGMQWFIGVCFASVVIFISLYQFLA